MRFIRTVIGSFPRLDEDYHRSVDKAVNLQLRNNIDLLSDGEQRGDMVIYFARDIPGLSVEKDFPIVSGKITPPEDPSKVQKVADYFFVRDKYPALDLKVTLTGPTALGVTCASRKIAGDYRNIRDFSLYEDLAFALKEIIKPLIAANAYIQIDEPYLSQGFTDLQERISLIDQMLEGSNPSKCALHICGYLGKQHLLDKVARLKNIGVLSHAFSSGIEKDNIQLLNRSIFQDNGKKLGAGIVSVSPRNIDSVDAPADVSARLSVIVDRIGTENIEYVHPDCGLGATQPDLVETILKNFDEGTRLFEHSS